MLGARYAVLATLLTAWGCGGGNEFRAHLPAGDPVHGRAVFVEMRCHSCHLVRGQDALPAPVVALEDRVSLGGRVAVLPTTGAIATQVAEPGARRGRGHHIRGVSRMPDLAGTMTVRELADVAAFVQASYELDGSYSHYH